MGKVPVDLRHNIALNIRNCRQGRYPRWGGSKKCAEDFGVSPQQWSQWERGIHMPDEYRMMEIARFFGVTTAFLRRNNTLRLPPLEERPKPSLELAAVRIVDGVETPLRVEIEKLVFKDNFQVRVERIL